MVVGLGAAAASWGVCGARAQAPQNDVATESEWLRALATVLSLVRADEPAPSEAELARRLGRPAPIDLAAHVTAHSPHLSSERRLASGGGSTVWYSTGEQPASVVFRTLLHRLGRYEIAMALSGGPHVLVVGAQETRAIGKAGAEATPILEELELLPGWTDVVLSLVPGGAAAPLTLVPEAASPIAPLAGWQPSRPLTWGVKATTIVRLGGWEHELPPEGPPVPASVVGGFDSSGVSTRRFRTATSGVYTVAVRAAGAFPSKGRLDRTLVTPRPMPLNGSPGMIALCTVALDAGDHDLEIESSGTVEAVMLQPRKSSEISYLSIAQAHGFAETGRAATVDHRGIQKNVDAIVRWLKAPSAALAIRARKGPPLRPPPDRPRPISPLLPGDL